MEDWQILLIKDKFSELVDNTICGPEFLNIFYSARILTKDEYDRLNLPTMTPLDKSTDIYKNILPFRDGAYEKLKEALLKTDQSGAFEILKLSAEEEGKLKERAKKMTSEELYGKQPWLKVKNLKFDVLPPVDLFTGRRNELDHLHEIVLRSEKAARVTIISQMTSVSGLGGIGKTQLARQYIEEKGDEFDGNVIWLNAETEANLGDSFRRLATEKLRISTKDANGAKMSLKSVVEVVFNFFKNAKAFFIFDNAERLPWLLELLRLTPKGSKLFMLMTSRDREWDSKIEVMDLKVFTVEDAVAFVLKGLELEEEGEDEEPLEAIKRLVKRLQFFPLALQQAISYIHEQQKMDKYTIAKYQGEFEAMEEKLLRFERFPSFENDYTKTTFTTWKITKAKIDEDAEHGKLALHLLDLMAYLNPTNIQRKLFFSVHDTDGDGNGKTQVLGEKVKYAVNLLIKYSMISGEERQSILSIHRLVQEVTRIEVDRKQEEENVLRNVLRLLLKKDEYFFLTENLPHGLVAWRHAWNHSQIIRRHSDCLPWFLMKMGHVGMHDEAILFGKEALEQASMYLGENHRDSLCIERVTANILILQGKLQDSLDILKKVWEKAKENFGEDNDLTLGVQNELAAAFANVGNFEDALKLNQLNYNTYLQRLGPNHKNTLTAQTSLAVTLDISGRPDEALKMYTDLIEKETNLYGENHSQVLISRLNTAGVYSSKGNYEESIKITEDIYKRLCPVSYENADFFSGVCQNLCSYLSKVGKFKEVIKVIDDNYEKIRELLGDYKALQLLPVKGCALRGIGNVKQALEIHQKCYKGLLGFLGEDHQGTLISRRLIAEDLFLLGNYDESILIYKEVLNKLHLSNYEQVIETIKGLAWAIERSGEDLNQAMTLLQEAKLLQLSHFGENSPNYRKILDSITRLQIMETQRRLAEIQTRLMVANAIESSGEDLEEAMELLEETKALIFSTFVGGSGPKHFLDCINQAETRIVVKMFFK